MTSRSSIGRAAFAPSSMYQQPQQQQQQQHVLTISPLVLSRPFSRENSSSSSTAQSSVVGSLNLTNHSFYAIIFKVRGNQPRHYRLSSSSGIIDPNQTVSIDVRLLDIQLFSKKDLFQVNFLLLTQESDEFLHNCGYSSHLTSADDAHNIWPLFNSQSQLWPIQQDIIAVKLTSERLSRASVSSPKTAVSLSSNLNNSYINQQLSPISLSKDLNTQSLSQSSSLRNQQPTSIDTSLRSSLSNQAQTPLDFHSLNDTQQQSVVFSVTTAQKQEMSSKQLYENLIVKVDDQDKHMFMLNLERKKLEAEWIHCTQKHQMLKSEQQVSHKHNNGIKVTAALIVAFISLIFGLYLGN